MRILNILFCIVFLAMAALQFNDPDPYYWIVVYTAVAWTVGASVTGRRNSFTTAVILGLVSAGLLISVAGFAAYVGSGNPASIFNDMSGADHYVEPAREFLGLTIAFLVLIYNYRER